jgi:CrcB protein
MRNVLLVGLGGFVGSVLRHGVSTVVPAGVRFPAATLVVNVVGCLVIGILGGLAEARMPLSDPLRLFLIVGVLGGFTTYSAFGYETIATARGGAGAVALLNVVLHLVMGLGAVWVGFRAGEYFGPGLPNN